MRNQWDKIIIKILRCMGKNSNRWWHQDLETDIKQAHKIWVRLSSLRVALKNVYIRG
jgi:hypothetical protein